MIDKKDIERLPHQFRDMILAMSLSRIYKHFKDGMFGIVTAWKDGKTKKENLESMYKLRGNINNMGYGYGIPTIGSWKGKIERSIFIPGISQADIQELAAKYNQDAYLHGSDAYWVCYDVSGNKLHEGTEFKVSSIDDETENYTIRRNRKFQLATIITNIERKLETNNLSYRKRQHLEKTLEGYKKKIKKNLTFYVNGVK